MERGFVDEFELDFVKIHRFAELLRFIECYRTIKVFISTTKLAKKRVEYRIIFHLLSI